MTSTQKQKLREFRRLALYFYTEGYQAHAKQMGTFLVPNEIDFTTAWQEFETAYLQDGRIPGPKAY